MTTPDILKMTAKNLLRVNLSLNPDGRHAAKSKVKRLLLEDNTLTSPASV